MQIEDLFKELEDFTDVEFGIFNKLLKEKKITPKDLVLESFERIEKDKDLNCFITLNKEEALNSFLDDFNDLY